MAELIVVRHAQASFGTDDYDRLSELGWQQARWLGEYLAARGDAFDFVLRGSLRRHAETLSAMAESLSGLPAERVMPGLNEYQAEPLMAAWLKAKGLPPIDRTADRKAHFRTLREVLRDWIDGSLAGADHMPYAEFAAGVAGALEVVRASGASRVLMVSSGGPISVLMCQVLRAEPHTMVELNLQTRNSGVSEFAFNAKRVFCVGFNAVPHLDRQDRRGAVTHS